MELLLKYQQKYQADLVCLGHFINTDTSSVSAIPDADPTLMLDRNGQQGLLLPPGMEGFSWNKLYRLDIIREHGLRFPDGMDTTEDLWFSYCYLDHCSQICHAPSERIYHYCQREDSSTQCGFGREKMGTLNTYEQIIADCSARDPELAAICCDRICTEAVNLLWLHENARDKDPEAHQHLLSYIRRLIPGYLRSSLWERSKNPGDPGRFQPQSICLDKEFAI